MVSVSAEPRPAGFPAPRLFVSTAIIVVALDHLTKWVAVRELGDGDTIGVFWKLQWNLHYNRGAAFSMGRSIGPFIGLLVVGVVIGLAILGRRAVSRPVAACLGLIAGGAVGNLLDRIFRDPDGFLGGGVVDFIDFQFWPIFNIADMAVVIGGMLLVFVSAKEESLLSPRP